MLNKGLHGLDGPQTQPSPTWSVQVGLGPEITIFQTSRAWSSQDVTELGRIGWSRARSRSVGQLTHCCSDVTAVCH